MNKKMVIATILILIDLMVIYYLYSKSEKEFLFIFIAIFIVLLGFLIYNVATNKSSKDLYYSNVNRIVKNYSALLVESSIPSLAKKDIIYIKDIDNLANAAIQLKKPIYFIKDPESCAFIILDNNLALVNIYKQSKISDNRIETMIN